MHNNKVKRRNVIGWDGKGVDTNTRYLKLVDDLAEAQGDLDDARRDRRNEERTGDVSVETIDRVRQCEQVVTDIKAEMKALAR